MVRRTVLAVLFAAGAVPLTAQPCWACDCVAGPETQKEREQAAEEADVVFTGKVRKIEPGSQVVKVRFWVGRKYKGTHREKLMVKTPSHEAACGVSFKDGKRYTVFAHGDGPYSYWAYSCGETQRGRINGERYGFD